MTDEPLDPAAEFDRRLREELPELAETAPNTPEHAGDTLNTDPDSGPDSAEAGEEAAEGASTADHAPAPRYQIHDWEAIRRAYIEGWPDKQGTESATYWPTLREVAARFEVSDFYIRQQSSKQGWAEQRRSWQAQMEATRRQTRAAALAKSGADVDNKALDAAQLGLQLCLAALGDIAQRAQRRRSDTLGTGESSTGIDALEQQRLASAVDLWHKVGLRSVGDPQTHRLEITGANGGPVEVAAELRRDDPDRLAGVLAVLAAADLGDVIPGHVLASSTADDGGGDGVPAEVGSRR